MYRRRGQRRSYGRRSRSRTRTISDERSRSRLRDRSNDSKRIKRDDTNDERINTIHDNIKAGSPPNITVQRSNEYYDRNNNNNNVNAKIYTSSAASTSSCSTSSTPLNFEDNGLRITIDNDKYINHKYDYNNHIDINDQQQQHQSRSGYGYVPVTPPKPVVYHKCNYYPSQTIEPARCESNDKVSSREKYRRERDDCRDRPIATVQAQQHLPSLLNIKTSLTQSFKDDHKMDRNERERNNDRYNSRSRLENKKHPKYSKSISFEANADNKRSSSSSSKSRDRPTYKKSHSITTSTNKNDRNSKESNHDINNNKKNDNKNSNNKNNNHENSSSNNNGNINGQNNGNNCNNNNNDNKNTGSSVSIRMSGDTRELRNYSDWEPNNNDDNMKTPIQPPRTPKLPPTPKMENKQATKIFKKESEDWNDTNTLSVPVHQLNIPMNTPLKPLDNSFSHDIKSQNLRDSFNYTNDVDYRLLNNDDNNNTININNTNNNNIINNTLPLNNQAFAIDNQQTLSLITNLHELSRSISKQVSENLSNDSPTTIATQRSVDHDETLPIFKVENIDVDEEELKQTNSNLTCLNEVKMNPSPVNDIMFPPLLSENFDFTRDTTINTNFINNKPHSHIYSPNSSYCSASNYHNTANNLVIDESYNENNDEYIIRVHHMKEDCMQKESILKYLELNNTKLKQIKLKLQQLDQQQYHQAQQTPIISSHNHYELVKKLHADIREQRALRDKSLKRLINEIKEQTLKENQKHKYHHTNSINDFDHVCKLCDCSFERYQNYLSHLYSIEHVKKFESKIRNNSYYDAYYSSNNNINNNSNTNNCNNNIINTSTDELKGTEFLLPTRAFYCCLCDETCANEAMSEFHVQSIQHIQKYQELMKE